jgi:hypothetical protein
MTRYTTLGFLLAAAVGAMASPPTVGPRATPSAAASRSSAPAHKRALLVAVSDYGSKYGKRRKPLWVPLHCRMDAENMRKVLIDTYGFKDDDILMLEDLRATRGGRPVPGLGATRQGILTAFRRHLIDPAQPGDVAVFLFAGHGQPVRDPEGVRVKPDGLDPSIVPYDYVTQSAKDGEKANIRGYDFQKLLRALSEKMRGAEGKVEGNITCIIDSCHSNTIVRGSQVARGRGWDERIDGPKPRPPAAVRGDPGLREGQSSPEGSGLLPTGEALARGYVLLTACQSHESAYEVDDENGKPLGGALTYNLCLALRHATARTTYRDLFERLSLDIKAERPNQTPALEGEVHQLLFSGVARPAPVHPLVQAYRDGIVTIGAGELHEVTVHSRFALYKPGSDTSDPRNRLAEVEVGEVGISTCRARLTKQDLGRLAAIPPTGRPLEEKLRAARAVMIARYFGDRKLRVLLQGTEQLAPLLKKRVGSEEQDPLQLLPVSLSRGAGEKQPLYDIKITREGAEPAAKGADGAAGKSALVVLRNDNTLMRRLPDDETGRNLLRGLLIQEWRRRLLTQPMPSQGAAAIDVRVHVIPVEVRELPGGYVEKLRDLPHPERTPSGRLVMRAGQFFQVELENAGNSEAYVTVFDLQPDGSIFPVFPNPEQPQVVPNIVHAGAGLRVPWIFGVKEPFGNDIYQAIATLEPVDFTPLIYSSEQLETRGAQLKQTEAKQTLKKATGYLGPLARLLLGASTGTRGAQRVPTEEAGYSVRTELVETRPRVTAGG